MKVLATLALCARIRIGALIAIGFACNACLAYVDAANAEEFCGT